MNELIARATEQRERGKALLAGVSDPQFNQRPNTDTWSLGQQFDHINTVLEKVLEEIDKASAQGAPTGDPALWKPNFLERKFIEMVERKFIEMVGAQPGGRTNPVPKGFEPTEAALSVEATRTRFLAAQDGLLRRMQENQNTNLKKIKVASSAVPWLKLSLGAWFAAMEMHTGYHLDKAAGLRDQLPVP